MDRATPQSNEHQRRETQERLLELEEEDEELSEELTYVVEQSQEWREQLLEEESQEWPEQMLEIKTYLASYEKREQEIKHRRQVLKEAIRDKRIILEIQQARGSPGNSVGIADDGGATHSIQSNSTTPSSPQPQPVPSDTPAKKKREKRTNFQILMADGLLTECSGKRSRTKTKR